MPPPRRVLLAPNARCPVCGALVYFYANEHGSKVWFDEVGPPWPKHPCLIAPATGTATPGPRHPAAPGPGVAPSQGAGHARHLPVEPWTVVRRSDVSGQIMLEMHPPHRPGHVSAWLSPYAVALQPGDHVFLADGWISWFDRHRFEVVTSPVTFVVMVTAQDSPLMRLLRRLIPGAPWKSPWL